MTGIGSCAVLQRCGTATVENPTMTDRLGAARSSKRDMGMRNIVMATASAIVLATSAPALAGFEAGESSLQFGASGVYAQGADSPPSAAISAMATS